MTQFWIKTLFSALLIAGISELSKRNLVLGSLLASLPLTSLLAFVWLYLETRNTNQVAQLSTGIFWLVIPSLLLFIVFPILLKRQMPFFPALLLSCALTGLAYYGTLMILPKLGILKK